jgi:hypothetical protein
MDPHPFWLTPWLGQEGRPLGILAEYRSKHFKVAPTLEEFSSLAYESGFRIRRILEPRIEDAYRKIDPQGYAFMSEFPQWWFWELENP